MSAPARPPARPPRYDAPAHAPVRPAYCRHTGPSRNVRTQTANGHWQVRSQCMACSEMHGPAKAHAAGWEQLPIVAAVYLNPPCAVCGEQPTTNHHWLPRALANKAGLNCEAWPQAYLCHKHHMEWHGLVTPGLVSEGDKMTREKSR